jgi:hypothetical protein
MRNKEGEKKRTATKTHLTVGVDGANEMCRGTNMCMYVKHMHKTVAYVCEESVLGSLQSEDRALVGQ